jgi:hypothetical protein
MTGAGRQIGGNNPDVRDYSFMSSATILNQLSL